MISKYKLERLGEPLGECVTRKEGCIVIYGGGGGSSGGSSTTVQSIPEELKPLATQYTNKAIDLSNQGFTPYTGQRYEDLNPTQYASLGMTANRALNGSQTMNNAESNLNQMMSGGPNPYLDSMVKRAQDSVSSNATTGMIGSGSFGNSGLNEQYAKSMGDVASQMYGNAYQNDQQNRLNAIQMAPTFGNQAYQDAAQLMNAGQTLQDQGQQNKDFAYQQFQEQQNLPYKNLAAMSGVFGSNLGGTSTTTQSGGGGK